MKQSTNTPHNKIDEIFERQIQGNRIMPFIEAGLPNLKTTEKTILACEKEGAQLIELGIPFSDPLADGPTIQLASEKALAAGTTLASALDMVKSLRQRSDIPIVIFTYYNPVFSMGIKAFVKRAKAVGAEGVLIPDLPLEESESFEIALKAAGMHFIHLISLTSSEQRIKAICKRASGFLYLVSTLGVTGARSSMDRSLNSFVKRVRRHTKLPLAVGFGISTREHVEDVCSIADGAIIGSALANKMMSVPNSQVVKAATNYIKGLSA